MSGPRYLAGDLNHDLDNLPVLQRLQALHFVEVQDLFQSRTGIAPKATCKGRTRRDYLFLSPELATLFVDVTIDPHAWADHATIVAKFCGGNSALKRYPWPLPQPLPWNNVQANSISTPVNFEPPVCCTRAYSQLWQSVEARVSHSLQASGQTIHANSLGRGQRLERHIVVGSQAPLKRGRSGEFQPRFFGLSYLHAHRLKQVRRLQSFIRLRAVTMPSSHHVEHCVSLWQAIRNAAGFSPSFQSWWETRSHVLGDPDRVPEYPPDVQIAQAFLNAMQLEVRNLEVRLQATRKRQQQKKRSTGIAHLYASVRRDAPVPVDVLLETKQATIGEVDADLSSVVLKQPVVFDPNVPLSCNGQPLQPIVITDDQIFLECVDGISPGDLLCQTKGVGKLEDVFEAFTQQWRQRWDKHADVPYSHWNNLFEFATARFGRIEAPCPTFEPDLIRAIAHSKKTKAAIGLDGVSRADCLHLNYDELTSLGNVYRRAHTTGDWPAQLTHGQIKSLAKKENPGGVGDFRPITIFSFVYRIWSSLTSQHWLKHVSPVLDTHLSGNRIGHRASYLWRAILEDVEAAHGTGVHCAGIVFDLEKAFNTLPRLVCLGLAKIMGVGHSTLVAWSGALGSMQRSFVVLGSLSPPVGSHCGFAEGCGMSCLAMMMLDQLWHIWIKEATALSKPMSFVDNWEVVVQDPSLISVVADATFTLAAQLEVVVDKDKSFAWATSKGFRGSLRHLGFQVKLDTADLGAHVTYSRQQRNSSLLARFANLRDFWVKLKVAFGNHQQKAQVVLRAAWPRAMHAISATWVGLKHYHGLRCAYMQAQRLDRPGANAFLQLHCDGFLMDPHAFSILQTFRDHRDLGVTSWQSNVLADFVHGKVELPNNSLTHVLLKRVQVLQWAILPDGLVRDALGAFCLHSINWSELCFRFQESWQLVVANEISHRLEFQGFENVDVMNTRRALQRLPSYQQGICRRNLNGSTLTNEHAFHWSDSGNHICPHCSSADSLHHRYWECPHSQDLRALLDPIIVDLVPSLPKACTVRSWFLRSPLVWPWWTYLLSLPACFPPPAVTLEGRGPIDFFTDGSCLHQDSCIFRMASWAVCWAKPFDETLNAGKGDSHVVAAEALSGLVQTAFRAELTALCAALFYGQFQGRQIRIWTDCQGVQMKFTALVQGGCQLRPNSPNTDLWAMVLELVSAIGADNIQVIKVAAHQTLPEGALDVDAWVHYHNSAVDRAARVANLNRSSSAWSLWEELALQTTGLLRISQDILQFQLQVCQRWSASAPMSQPVRPPREPRQREIPVKACQMRCCDVPALATQKVLGRAYSRSLLAWWNSIIDHSQNLQWVSFAQLYIHFQLTQRHSGLVRCGKKWSNPSYHAVLQPENFSFRQRARWFRHQLQQMWRDLHWELSTATTRPQTDCIVSFVGCVSIPAKQSMIQQVDGWLASTVRPIREHRALDFIPVAW